MVNEVGIAEPSLNILFSSLILTVLGVFIGGNILLLDFGVLWRSALITVPCFGIAFIFYGLSRHLGSPAWGLIVTYAALWAVVYSPHPESVYVFNSLCAGAAVYVARYLRLERCHWRPVLLMAVMGTATVLGARDAYTSFDMLSRLHLGDVSQDTLYHSSIAAMVKNYGVVSTGLHGLIETPYHTLSHVLMAAISLLSGIGVVEVYGVAPWVLFAPLLIYCVATCCAMLDHHAELSIPLVWGFTALLLSMLPFLFSSWAVWSSFFTSESYLVSLSLFLLSLGLLLKRTLTVLDLLLVVISSALIANAKGSVGLMYAGLWLTRVIWVRGDQPRVDFAALFLSGVAVGWSVIKSAGANSGDIAISPLHFVRMYSFWGSYLDACQTVLRRELPPIETLVRGAVCIMSFVVFHFLLSWVVLYQIVRHKREANLLHAPIAIYSLVTALASLLISFAITIPNGSAYYFSNVAFFVSLPAVVAILTLIWKRSRRDQTLMLGLGIVLISLISLPVYYHKSAFTRPHHVNNALINSLLVLKERSPLSLVLRANDQFIQANPVKSCTAQPFTFPAVSERPWIDVISDLVGECHYSYYGYSQYDISAKSHHVINPPRILPGMSIQKRAEPTLRSSG
jgi:hypothetical protein